MPSILILLLTAMTGAGIALVCVIVWRVLADRNRRSALEEEAAARRRKLELELEEARTRAELDQSRRANELETAWAKREAALESSEQEVISRKIDLDARERVLEQQEAAVDAEAAEVKSRTHELEKYTRLYRLRLYQLTRLSRQEAEERAREEARQAIEAEVRQLRSERLDQTDRELEEKANARLLAVMQRVASSPSTQTNATLVQLESEDMKGRIIGREGRNIRSFESATGCTLLIDDTPNSVLVSSFDPVRREIARMTLERLIKDGRINPASIEQTVEETTEELDRAIIEFGENALRRLRLRGVHPEVVELVGKLQYRLSNNQNTLEHSIEVAFISALIAAEFGIDPVPAKRAGLFHDMGKAISHEYEGSHAQIASEILKRNNEDPRVVNAVHAHHDEVEAESLYAGILKVADALSAMRPGARADSLEGYVKRIKALEGVARDLPGVSDAYALQAGREIRVIVEPETVDDQSARSLAQELRRRIEEELHYPSAIKITVIREARFTETAK
ncbi:MAG: ribonuclease Y [Opitutales bacterium]